MSDPGRKSFYDKASESLKPESEKGYLEKGKENVTDGYDRLASKVGSDENKSATQGVFDSAKDGKDKADAENAAESYSDTAKEYMDSAKNKLNDAVEYVSNKMNGGEQ